MHGETTFSERTKRLEQSLLDQGLAALALVPGPNMRYLTGARPYPSERLTLGLVAPGQMPAFVVPAFEAERFREELGDRAAILGYTDEEGPAKALAQASGALGLRGKRVGAEAYHMRLFELLALREVAGVEVVPADSLLTSMRMIKDAGEIAAMREAIQRTERVLHAFVGQIRPGQTEKELAAKLDFGLRLEGGEELSFSPIVAAGPNSALPHAMPSDRPLEEGDLLVIDCGLFYKGYPSDITRTFAIGKIDPEMQRVYEVVAEANRAGREASKPGASAESVDRAARSVIEAAGYGEYFTHRTGHGLGLEVHEPPYIVEGNDMPLQPGMTFTVEPGIYFPGRGGVRIEDDVAITEIGGESLTTFPRELTIL